MTAQLITTDKLQPGDKVEHRRNGDRFTVDSVTPAKLDWRFHTPGAARSETGLEIVGHDADGETVYFTAAQSCGWWVIELAATVARKEPAMATINPHLTLTTYGGIKPGDRVVKWPLNPTHPAAHLIARPVAEIVTTYRASGFDDHGISQHDRFTYYDHGVIEWRDTNGSLHTDRADEAVYIAPASN